jgi:pimeloyl-ACP methyl ester carboxylesterase
VLAPALPGFEGSAPAPLTDYLPSRLARIVIDELESRGVSRFALVGFSWGGSIGCRIDPDRLDALVLLDIGYQTYAETPTLEQRLAEFADADFADPTVVATAFHGVDVEPAVEALSALADSGIPVLLLVATEPHVERRAADLARFRASVPQAEVREVAGGEHNLLETRPQETIAAVGEWLRTVTMARP